MAFDPTFRTSQEYLNIKAGFTGTLRTKQECLAVLSGRTNSTNSVIVAQDQMNSYASTTGRTKQNAANVKVASVGDTLTSQEAIRRF